MLASPSFALAQGAWHEGFEGPQPTWRQAEADASFRVVKHERVEGSAHGEKACEWLQIEGGGGAGSHVHFAHDVGRPRVIDELRPSVWVKSDRPGPSFAIRVALPRTKDPRTGRPLAVVLAGTVYSDVGRWQLLEVTDISRLLSRQIQVLHTQLGPNVDAREAYVDAVLLNVYGGQGTINVWIDDLDVAGHGSVQTGESAASPDVAAWTPASTEAAGPMVPVRLPPVDPPPERKPHTSKLVGSVLVVDGRPMFPRVIEHRGEPLAELKKLGFNAVWLERTPAPEVLDDAERLGLWLICPPPRGLGPAGEIGPAFDNVIAWDLGGDLMAAELPATQQLADQVRTADRRGNRPLICRPRAELRAYTSGVADLLLIDRRPLGTSLGLAEWSAWVRRQPLLARPGTPVWTSVQTQPNEALRQQLAAFEPNAAPPSTVSPEQIRLLAYQAVASGSRGLLFVSGSPLDAADAETRQRAMALELLNHELAIIEPWAAAGDFLATADATENEVVASVLSVKRARLLLPIWNAPGSQYVPPQSAANALTLVAPGVPETAHAYELTPRGLQPIRTKRVTGGMSVTLDEFGLTAQVLLAGEPTIVAALRGRAAESGRRAAELQRDLAARKLNTVLALAGPLGARSRVADAPAWLAAASKSLQTCDGQLAAGDLLGASQNAQRAARSLRLVERAYWDAAVKGLASPATIPGAASFETMPAHWRMRDQLQVARPGPNRIAGGDFEDIDTMMRSGWRYLQHAPPSLLTAVDLLPEAARNGRLGLRLAVSPADPQKPPAAVESPPILFTSPPVQVMPGQIVCIHGYVQVPGPITGSSDGLLIVDSLGGEALADRVGPTEGWREFALYRVAPQQSEVCVTFALSGMGEVRLDDVSIQVLERPAAMPGR